jgi:hypothetical protein
MTTTVRAISVDDHLLGRVLRGGLAGEIHSTFDSVVNISVPSGLITVAARHLDNAPNTVVIDSASMSPLRARLGGRVVAHGPRLVCPGHFSIDLDGAAIWHADLPDLSAVVQSQRLEQMVTELERLVDREGQPGGIRPRRGAQGTIEQEVSRVLDLAAHALVRSLAAGDLAAAIAWAERLIGLGPGLTPSGDDFVTGLAAVIASPGTRMHALLPWVQELVRDSEPRTNVISWTAMHEAAHGRVRESITAVLRAVAAGDPEALRPAARKVIRIGKTSGTDIVTGVQAGLHLEKELRGVA